MEKKLVLLVENFGVQTIVSTSSAAAAAMVERHGSLTTIAGRG